MAWRGRVCAIESSNAGSLRGRSPSWRSLFCVGTGLGLGRLGACPTDGDAAPMTGPDRMELRQGEGHDATTQGRRQRKE